MSKRIKHKLIQANKIFHKKGFKKTSKIILERQAINLRQAIILYYKKILNWIYSSDESEIILEIEKRSFLWVWNSFRIIVLCILLFDHVITKILDPSFGLTFLLLSMLYSVLIMDRIIRKYPLRIFFGTILLP
jgi:hypothetical protein